MKKIINGKSYNTETAEEIVSASSNCGKSDFRWFKESLYRTKKGNYFLAGEGHAMTKYATHYDNMSGAGNGIFLLTKKEALNWLENNEETEKIEKYFSAEIEEA